MKIKQKYGTAVIIVVIAMVIILPLLAYLQYQWLGELSKQELAKMRNNLHSSAFLCSMKAERPISDFIRTLIETSYIQNDLSERSVRDAVEKWKSFSSHPQLISDSIKIISIPNISKYLTIKIHRGGYIYIKEDFSQIAVPLEKERDIYVIIPINKKYFVNELLPKIFQEHFSVNGEVEYDIVVVGLADSVFYANTENRSNYFYSSADLVTSFINFPAFDMDFRPKPPEMSFRPKPPKREFENERNNEPPIPPKFEKRNEKNLRAMPLGRMEVGFFQIFLKHRGGSLESVVNNNRLRNLALSFGVLLVLGASVIFLVISSHRSQQLALQQLQFVASVSHELRTPLAVLKSAGENLADGVIQQKERTQQYGELIKNEVNRLSEMVEKSLLYAGIQSGKQVFEMKPLEISEIIFAAIKKAEKFPHKINYTIQTKIENNLPLINGNSAALQSALENLLVNAIKYNREDGTIQISAENVLNSSFVKISVRDEGMGIPQNELKHIFKAFQRGSNAADAQIEGSGLGLSIAKHIITAHNGTLSAQSQLNNGSEFTIHLPALS